MEIFDVFLCHNSADEPAVRKIARMLVEEGIKPWLDERWVTMKHSSTRSRPIPLFGAQRSSAFKAHPPGDHRACEGNRVPRCTALTMWGRHKTKVPLASLTVRYMSPVSMIRPM